MIKISICGKMNSGKNTMAELFGYYLNDDKTDADQENPIKLMAFADPIKESVMQVFPWANRNCLWGSSALREEIINDAFDNNGNPLTYRQALNDIGGYGRKCNDRHWINVFNHRLKSITDSRIVICPDVRFCNEFDYLKSENFFNIKIIRNSIKNSNHPTEIEQDSIKLDLFDSVVYNNGSLPELEASVKEIANKIASLYGDGKSE